MKNIAIDFGNSSAKTALFEGSTLVSESVFTDDGELARWVVGTGAPHVMICNVGKDRQQWLGLLRQSVDVKELSPSTPLPIKIGYDTPNTLGMDRVAGAIGAATLFPQQPALVIDMGTCVTYDFITKDEVYMGGGISPGLSMRYKAMHTFTARLPLLEKSTVPPVLGKSTQECMQSGAVWGLAYELEGMMAYYKAEFGCKHFILCGGDAIFFERIVKQSIFVISNLILLGLNRILSTHVDVE